MQELLDMGRMLPRRRKPAAGSGSPMDGCGAAGSQPAAHNGLDFLAPTAEMEQPMPKWFVYSSVVGFLELKPDECKAWC